MTNGSTASPTPTSAPVHVHEGDPPESTQAQPVLLATQSVDPGGTTPSATSVAPAPPITLGPRLATFRVVLVA